MLGIHSIKRHAYKTRTYDKKASIIVCFFFLVLPLVYGLPMPAFSLPNFSNCSLKCVPNVFLFFFKQAVTEKWFPAFLSLVLYVNSNLV